MSAHTKYLKKDGSRWALTWKLMGVKFKEGTWKPENVIITLRQETTYVEQYNGWLDDQGKPTSWEDGVVWGLAGNIQSFGFREIYREVFSDIEEAARIYEKLNRKEFDDVRMMGIL